MVVWLLIVAVTSCVVCWNDGMLMLVDVGCYCCDCVSVWLLFVLCCGVVLLMFGCVVGLL